MIEAARHRSCRLAQTPNPPVKDGGHVGQGDQVAWALGARLGAFWGAGSRLACEWILAGTKFDPAWERPRHPRPRQRGERSVAALAEHEYVQAARSATKRVRAPFGPVHDAIAGADCIGVAVLPQQALTAEHVEDLLVGAVLVGRSRKVPIGDLDAPQANCARACSATEIVPLSLDVPDRKLARDPVVHVCDLHLLEVTSRHRIHTRRTGCSHTRASRVRSSSKHATASPGKPVPGAKAPSALVSSPIQANRTERSP